MQNPFIRRATGVVALVAVAGLTACVTQPQQSNYPPPYQAPGYQNQGYQNQGNAPYGTEYGRVVHIESLQSQQQNQTSGAGAVIGAVVGNMVEGSNQSGQQYQQGYRITIQLDQGGRRAYDVSAYGDVRVGDRVRLLNGQISRY